MLIQVGQIKLHKSLKVETIFWRCFVNNKRTFVPLLRVGKGIGERAGILPFKKDLNQLFLITPLIVFPELPDFWGDPSELFLPAD